jgi:hypothetical protein
LPDKYQMRGEPSARTRLISAGGGLLFGAVAVPLLTIAGPLAFFPFAALVGLAMLRRDSRATGGGFLVAFGFWWIFFIRQAVERCDAFNRNGGTCTISGTTEQIVFAGCVALVGALLIVVAMRDRTARRA